MMRESAVMRGTVVRAEYAEYAKRPKAPTEPHAKQGDPLTDRQRAILLSAATGRTYAEIAGDLGIAERTVKTHANLIFLKLDAVSMTNAVAIFLSTETEDRGRLRALVCFVRGHAVAWGPCDRCGRRAKG